MFVNIKNWIKNNPKEIVLLALILAIGAFFRLYKISEYMTFLGDEGRDVIIVRRIFTELHPPLVGPGTSVGNMYLGPLYYYMMAPALVLAGFSPVGPAVQVAILGVITILFVWFVGREWFGRVAALLAAVLYAISPTVIIFSRSSWNPNIMPFFALLVIYSVWRIWKYQNWKWLVVLGISFAFTLQSHYLALLLLPTIAIFWLLTFLNVKNIKDESKGFFKATLIGLILFLLLMSPLVIFDARHEWRNFTAIKTFFTQSQGAVSIKPWEAVPKVPLQFEQVTTRLLTGRDEIAGKWTSIVIVILLVWLIFIKRKKSDPKLLSTFYFLLIWFGFGLIGLGLYRQEIYDHYYGFFFPAPFLLIGALTENLLKNTKNLGKILVVIVTFVLILTALKENPLKDEPNMQLQRSQEVARKILNEAKGQKFNLAVLAERNYEDGYRYYLELWGGTVLHADRWDKNTIGNELFVVCEMSKEKCDPTHSPKAEVANFGWSKIEDEWDIAGVTVYKLTHSK